MLSPAGCSRDKPEGGCPPCLGSTHLRVRRAESHLCPDQTGAQRTSSEPRSPRRLQGQPVLQALHETILWVRSDSSVVRQLGDGAERSIRASWLEAGASAPAAGYLLRPSHGPGLPWSWGAPALPSELPLQGCHIWLAGARGEVGTREPRVSPGTCLHRLPLRCVPVESGRASPTGLVVLHPLVEEKVKEQLEAAKPEPVIEEVVSARGRQSPSLLSGCFFPTCSRLSPSSSSLSSLSTSLLPLISPSFFSHFPTSVPRLPASFETGPLQP